MDDRLYVTLAQCNEPLPAGLVAHAVALCSAHPERHLELIRALLGNPHVDAASVAALCALVEQAAASPQALDPVSDFVPRMICGARAAALLRPGAATLDELIAAAAADAGLALALVTQTNDARLLARFARSDDWWLRRAAAHNIAAPLPLVEEVLAAADVAADSTDPDPGADATVADLLWRLVARDSDRALGWLHRLRCRRHVVVLAGEVTEFADALVVLTDGIAAALAADRWSAEDLAVTTGQLLDRFQQFQPLWLAAARLWTGRPLNSDEERELVDKLRDVHVDGPLSVPLGRVLPQRERRELLEALTASPHTREPGVWAALDRMRQVAPNEPGAEQLAAAAAAVTLGVADDEAFWTVLDRCAREARTRLPGRSLAELVTVAAGTAR